MQSERIVLYTCKFSLFREIQLGQCCKQKFPLFFDKKGGSKDINREKPSRVSHLAHTG